VTTNLRRAGDTVAPVGWAAREVVTGDAVTDVVAWSGLAVGERYRVEMSLQQRLADGTCVPIGAATSVDVVPDAHAGVVQVSGLAVPGPGVFVAFQRVFAGDRMVAAHLDCGDERQTLWVADATPQPPPPSPPPSTTPEVVPPTVPSTGPTTTPTTAPPDRPASITRPLPRTGGSDARNAVALGAGLLCCGTGLALLARRPGQRRSRLPSARPDMV
jgi:hypothetical protein